MSFRLVISGFFLLGMLFVSCSPDMDEYQEVGSLPSTEPDISGVVIPPDIAPLNFVINEDAADFLVKLNPEGSPGKSYYFRSNIVRFPEKDWKDILEKCKGKILKVEVYARSNGKWRRYKDIIETIAEESIDDYLVYRLIEPGFKGWKRMGIYQRALGSFKEKPVFTNNLSKGNCMNCHSFCMNSNEKMLLHMRGKIAGTVIYNKGELKWVNTKTSKTISAGVYPHWHPDGNHIAFSVNQIIQRFHAVSDKKIEVIDTLSDVVIYNIKENKIFTDISLASTGRYETFPCWSPDGKSLYFCSSEALPYNRFNEIKYDLLRISFDPEKEKTGTIDTVLSSSKTGMSVSFPRISPDGRFLLLTMSAYGNFSIWHSESNLYLLDLISGELSKPDINSDFAESYHSWSSNGRWVVFSSRRDDGLYTRPYISYFDSEGEFHKPFLLPVKDPKSLKSFMKSYNIPEFVKSEVMLSKRELYRLIRSKPIDATYD